MIWEEGDKIRLVARFYWNPCTIRSCCVIIWPFFLELFCGPMLEHLTSIQWIKLRLSLSRFLDKRSILVFCVCCLLSGSQGQFFQFLIIFLCLFKKKNSKYFLLHLWNGKKDLCNRNCLITWVQNINNNNIVKTKILTLRVNEKELTLHF